MSRRRPTAAGKVLWHFTMSLDGYVASPDNSTDWAARVTARPGLIADYAATTGAVLGAGSAGMPTLVEPADGVTFLPVMSPRRYGSRPGGLTPEPHRLTPRSTVSTW